MSPFGVLVLYKMEDSMKLYGEIFDENETGHITTVRSAHLLNTINGFVYAPEAKAKNPSDKGSGIARKIPARL